MDWRSRAERKRDSINSQIPNQWRIKLSATLPQDVTGRYIQQYLTSEEIKITESSALSIIENLSDGTLTAREVVEAFCHRAAVAHQLIPCLSEIFFSSAPQRASELDSYFRKHGKSMGPLHGLPVSLKDQVNVEGIDSATGVVAYIGNGPENKDAEIVRSLRSLGAIPFVKTTVPQFSFAFTTETNIFGHTLNPINRSLSAGGSSGGEGALLALRGSPVGLGSDIGGSIRVPSGFCGLCGLKPSTGRLPFYGIKRVGDGQPGGTGFAIGPMAANADALTIMTKALLSQEPWLHDPDVVPLPWNDQIYQNVVQAARGQGRKLVIGLIRDDGIVRPHPPVQRAVEMMVSVLRKEGHEIVEWDPPNHAEATKLTYTTFTFDGGAEVHAGLSASGEPFTAPLLKTFGTAPRAQSTASEIMATNVAIRDYRKRYLDYWTTTGVDAVISPVSPYSAPEVGKNRYLAYTPWVNLLDYSAAVIPVMRVDRDIDVVVEPYTPLGEEDGICHESYDPEIFHNSSVGIQIIGRRFEEEKVCALAEVFEAALSRIGKDGTTKASL